MLEAHSGAQSSMAPPYEELRSTLAIWFDDESVHCKQRREVSAHCLMSTGSPCSPTRNRRANRLLWVMRHMGRTGDAPQRSQQWQTSATASRNHFCCIAIDRCFKIPGPSLSPSLLYKLLGFHPTLNPCESMWQHLVVQTRQKVARRHVRAATVCGRHLTVS